MAGTERKLTLRDDDIRVLCERIINLETRVAVAEQVKNAAVMHLMAWREKCP